MEFDTDWLTLGRHRVRPRPTKGFPTQAMRTAVEVIRIAIDNNMSARARLRPSSDTDGKRDCGRAAGSDANAPDMAATRDGTVCTVCGRTAWRAGPLSSRTSQ